MGRSNARREIRELKRTIGDVQYQESLCPLGVDFATAVLSHLDTA